MSVTWTIRVNPFGGDSQMMALFRILLPPLLLATLLGCAHAAVGSVPLQIPMRDGKLLAADLYSPRPDQPLPVVLIQTPYNKTGFRERIGDPANPLFGCADYAFVVVDWRGRFASKAAGRMNARTQGQDGYDCVEWVAAQPWCNGKIGTWGPSALGRIQYQTALENPPHLVCCVPVVAPAQYRYVGYYPGGAARIEYLEMLDKLGFGMKDMMLAHPTEDGLWRAAGLSWRPGQVRAPMLLVGGWYDLHPEEMLLDFADLRTESDASVRSEHRLLIGPWAHSFVDEAKQGALEFPDAAATGEAEAKAWFDRWLRGQPPSGWQAAIKYYRMGASRWETAASWPPESSEAMSLYLADQGALSATPSGGAEAKEGYGYDPSDPTPTVGGALLNRFQLQPGPQDLRALQGRQDVLFYTTEPLDEPMRITGAPEAELFITSDRTDTDFAVRLSDVYPDGRSMLITDGILRCRYRESFSRPEMMTPGEVYRIRVQMPPTAATFAPGHRIGIVISSANYPRFNPNYNDGQAPNGPGPGVVAHNEVWRGGSRPSRLVLPVTG